MALSPHKWGIVRKDFDFRLNRAYEVVISRHKTQLAADYRLGHSGKSKFLCHVRRLTDAERRQ